MKKLKDLNYGFIGLGLMGGSLAKAVREKILNVPNANGKIFAADINSGSLNLAVQDKIIDKGYDISAADTMLESCDLVYVCLYPHATLDFLKTHKNDFKPGTVITDISGVKSFILENKSDFVRSDTDFIPGHPMAGGEKEGFSNSSGAFFQNRNYILMPQKENRSENLELIRKLIRAIGFKHIIETDHIIHDHKIAFTSQLCHIIASSLVDSAEDDKITAFGGGSYEDLTRIAMINAPLWTELFLANKKELLNHITAFEKALSNLKDAIKRGDGNTIEKILSRVRAKRLAMSCIDSTV
ncbi:prephenate dehydrogenase [Treponema parvum]|uniref:Prephenate dehydrogenase n=1 Tax=Treponema parvum TaxID=138851 RepID=A0A975EZ78_9SPIR|nr:prephenate dehydrogenase [Treponema parvum]QTQ11109.1 prephenate dehydrogenase [Treponema parvum]